MKNRKIEKVDVVVVGGGVAGTIAAIASARKGARTILIHDRPVLGGNASSEVRVHIGGATEHGHHYDCRETGIIEEIRLTTAVRDPYNTFTWIDTELYTKCYEEKNLKVYLNSYVYEVETEPLQSSSEDSSKYEKRIKTVKAIISGSETELIVHGKVFIDGTGHGTLGHLAGAKFRLGRESRKEFKESLAPEKEDKRLLGASILFKAEDLKRGKIDFTPPSWAVQLNPALLKRIKKNIPGPEANHGEYWHSDTVGWWWIELGGNPEKYHVIHDTDKIRHDLQALCFGIWDYIKNKHPNSKIRKMAENFDITWIGSVPGHRESRRIIGDYIMKQDDVVEGRLFKDRVAYGGWSIDLHPGDFWNPSKSSEHTNCKHPYGIPFRSLYSKNIENLLMASRCISVTHVAHGSTRIIGTLATVAQAVGTAAQLCIKKNITPRTLSQQYIEELQQSLLKQDCNLLGIKNRDKEDKALTAKIYSNGDHNCEFTGAHTFIPLYFPIAQRFYLPPLEENKNTETPLLLELYLKNPSDHPVKIKGGMRKDKDRDTFISNEDIGVFELEIPPQYKGWIKTHIYKTNNQNKEQNLRERDIKEEGNYWIYLCPPEEEEEDAIIYWGLNYWHWPGTRIGYYNEEKDKWIRLHSESTPYYDGLIGPRGTLNLRIKNIRSPFPASMINNGLAHPFVGPNLWISRPFTFPYIPPFVRKKGATLKQIYEEYKENDVSSALLTIEDARKRIYSLQYGKDLDKRELEVTNGTLEEFPPKENRENTIMLFVEFKKPETIREIHFKFDTDLDNSFPHQNYQSMKIKDWPIIGKPAPCIRDLDLFYRVSEEKDIEKNTGQADQWILGGKIRENYQRFRKIEFKEPIKTDKLIIIPRRTWGFHTFNIYEIRIY